MVKDNSGLIKDLKAVFEKHNAFIDVNDLYDGHDNLCGKGIEIKSHSFTDGTLDIYIDDFEEFAEMVSA